MREIEKRCVDGLLELFSFFGWDEIGISDVGLQTGCSLTTTNYKGVSIMSGMFVLCTDVASLTTCATAVRAPARVEIASVDETVASSTTATNAGGLANDVGL